MSSPNRSSNQPNSQSNNQSINQSSFRSSTLPTMRDVYGQPINRSNPHSPKQPHNQSSINQSHNHSNNQSQSPKQQSASRSVLPKQQSKRQPHPQSSVKSPYQQAAYQQIQLASPKSLHLSPVTGNSPPNSPSINQSINQSNSQPNSPSINQSNQPFHAPQYHSQYDTHRQVAQQLRGPRAPSTFPPFSEFVTNQSIIDLSRACESLTDELFDEIDATCPIIAASVPRPSQNELDVWSDRDPDVNQLINGVKRLRPRSARVKLEDAKHTLSTADMGDYVSYLKRAPRVLRDIDINEQSGTPFGSPYRMNRTRKLSRNNQPTSDVSSSTKLSTNQSINQSTSSENVPDVSQTELDDVREHDVVVDPRRGFDRHVRPSFDEWLKKRKETKKSAISTDAAVNSEQAVMVIE